MVKTWEDALLPEEEKRMAHLEAQIAMLKHQRYKIQNAASKRISDAKKAKARKPVKRRSKKRSEAAPAVEAS